MNNVETGCEITVESEIGVLANQVECLSKEVAELAERIGSVLGPEESPQVAPSCGTLPSAGAAPTCAVLEGLFALGRALAGARESLRDLHARVQL